MGAGVTGMPANGAIFVLISHGPNGHGAYQLSGSRKSSGSSNPDELKNCHCLNNAADGAHTADAVQASAGFASGQSVRSACAPVGKNRDLRVVQKLQLALDPIAAAIFSRATRAFADSVGAHAHRILMFKRLDRRVPAVCHVRVDRGTAGPF